MDYSTDFAVSKISGYDKKLESRFKVTRDRFFGISRVECKIKDIKKCLDYIQSASFYPVVISLDITDVGIIKMYKNSFSGRTYIDKHKSSMWDDNYPQKWNDERIYEEINDIVNLVKDVKLNL